MGACQRRRPGIESEGEAGMNTVKKLLEENPQVSDYKLNTRKKESFELFYVKGKLETVRSTDTCDKQVTVYADHDGFRGDAAFYVYPSTTPEEIREKIASAVENALLISNEAYTLPEDSQEEHTIPSNFSQYSPADLASQIAETVFAANQVENGSLNSVEIFINHYTDTVANSRGLYKIQHRYDAMVEAIPTYNGKEQSVELYEQYNFSTLDTALLAGEISRKMEEVRARYQAHKPETMPECPVVLNKLELNDLFSAIAGDLNYSTVYSHSNLFRKGDTLQKDRTGDSLNIRMAGAAEGNVCSACFDSDGMRLGEIQLVKDGSVENYYGSNRFGQYLKETPTGNLRCLCVEPGSLDTVEGPYLEVLSMSGLQVDFFNDYIGGEIRLAYYHDGENCTPVTGISVSGALRQVLSYVKLSCHTAIHDGYMGPAQALLRNMRIF